MARLSELPNLPRMTITVHLVVDVEGLQKYEALDLTFEEKGVVFQTGTDPDVTTHFFVPYDNIATMQFTQSNT